MCYCMCPEEENTLKHLDTVKFIEGIDDVLDFILPDVNCTHFPVNSHLLKCVRHRSPLFWQTLCDFCELIWRPLTGYHWSQKLYVIGFIFFHLRRDEVWKVPSNFQHLSAERRQWAPLATTHQGAGSRGVTEGGRVQQESAAPPQLTPSPPGSASKPHTRVVSWQCEYTAVGTWRKQVPSASLFPQKCQENNKTKQNLEKWQHRFDSYR